MGGANSVSIARSEEEENPSVKQREPSPSPSRVSHGKSKEEDPSTKQGESSSNSLTEEDWNETDEEECGLCKFIKKGGCKESWTAVEKCVDEAEEDGDDDTRCKEVRMMFKTCIYDNPVYYEPIISAHAQMFAKMLSELQAEKEAVLACEAEAIAKALSKLQADKKEPIIILPAQAKAEIDTLCECVSI